MEGEIDSFKTHLNKHEVNIFLTTFTVINSKI